MPRLFDTDIKPSYASVDTLTKAVKKAKLDHLRWVAAVDGTGRYIAVFFGQEAMDEGVHFRGFCIVG